jgi:hypothetical protein
MDTDTIEQPVNNITDTSPTSPKFIPLELIIEYVNKDLNYHQVAKLVGCDPSNISRRLARIDYTPERLKAFKKSRADILAHVQSKLINSITDDEIEKAPLGTKTLAFCQLYDKERLERGQSTEILDVQAISLDINELIDQCKQALQPQDMVIECINGNDKS